MAVTGLFPFCTSLRPPPTCDSPLPCKSHKPQTPVFPSSAIYSFSCASSWPSLLPGSFPQLPCWKYFFPGSQQWACPGWCRVPLVVTLFGLWGPICSASGSPLDSWEGTLVGSGAFVSGSLFLVAMVGRRSEGSGGRAMLMPGRTGGRPPVGGLGGLRGIGARGSMAASAAVEVGRASGAPVIVAAPAAPADAAPVIRYKGTDLCQWKNSSNSECFPGTRKSEM